VPVGNLVGVGRVLGVLATPRWVGWTLLAIVAVIVCAGMAYWQLIRAESPTGSLLNAGYALQWPLFGVFFAALWWRMLHAESTQLAVIRGEIEDPDAAPDVTEADEAGSGPAAVVVDTTAGPFTPRPAGVRPGDGQGVPARGRARTDYNAMLAALARSDVNAADETR
jgi:DNA-binding transcriptional regulator of glucitol operon